MIRIRRRTATTARTRATPVLRAAPLGLAMVFALAGCAPAGPTGPAPDAPRAVLAIANPPYGGVQVFATQGATADMEVANLFTIPASEYPYAAIGGPDGRVYVASPTTGRITSVAVADVLASDPADGFARPATVAFGSPDLLRPVSIAFDARGDLWVADGRGSTAETPEANHLVRFAAADLAAVADGGSIDAASVLAFAEDPESWWPNQLVFALHVDDQDRLWYSDLYGWSIGRIDGLAGRAALETDVVPDLQILTFDPADRSGTALLRNPVGLALSDAGALYVGSALSDAVVRFDGAGAWSGLRTEVVPDARLTVGIPVPRFVALDAEGGLWALTNGTVDAPGYELVRVVGHATPTGDVALTPTERRTWATAGGAFGGGMRFFDR